MTSYSARAPPTHLWHRSPATKAMNWLGALSECAWTTGSGQGTHPSAEVRLHLPVSKADMVSLSSLLSNAAKICSSPSGVQNGRVVHTKYTFRGVAIYICDAGYDLIGPEVRSCQDNRTWSGLDPFCRSEGGNIVQTACYCSPLHGPHCSTSPSSFSP